MKTLQIAALAGAALFAFTACDGGKDTAADTSGTTPVACDVTLINSFNVPSCTDGQWRYEIETQCWAGSAWIEIQQTGSTQPWSEEHDMNSEQLLENPEGEIWGLDLAVVDAVGDVTSGSTSLFKCDDVEAGRSSTMTWAFHVTDLEGVESDCVAYGDDPSFFAGCADGNAW
jgi:hypothetical protein